MRLVYLSPVPWDSFAQRPHKFVQWFHSRTNGEVLWLDPYPTRFPTMADLRRQRAKGQLWQAVPPWLTVVRPRSVPVEPMPLSGTLHRLLWRDVVAQVGAFAHGADGWMLGFGKPSELALQLLDANAGIFSFYDAMDDFPMFYSGLSKASMQRREVRLAERVDRILASSTELFRRFERFGTSVALVPNACSQEMLPPVNALPPRPAQPVIGYVGTVAPWFDWPLVIALARQNPSAAVRIIGPLHMPPPEPLEPNIELLPACSHADAIRAITGFSVGLIPFKRTPLTASVDPIKYYEYLALGVPTISTSFGEMAFRHEVPGVFIVDEGMDLSHVLTDALAWIPDHEMIETFRNESSWGRSFDGSGLLSA